MKGAYGGEIEERDLRKVRYSYMDARRLANRRALIVRGPKRIYDPSLAHIGMILAMAASSSCGVNAQRSRVLLRTLDATRGAG